MRSHLPIEPSHAGTAREAFPPDRVARLSSGRKFSWRFILAVTLLGNCVGLRIPEGDIPMKKLLVICFALALAASMTAYAQDTMSHDTMKSDSAPKAMDVKGKISDDGKTFVSDKDKKTWTLVNPEAVKGHEGHHVVLNAHFYPDKMQAHVMSLTMAK
jgi:pentapeptide MXKDX repeat protein